MIILFLLIILYRLIITRMNWFVNECICLWIYCWWI